MRKGRALYEIYQFRDSTGLVWTVREYRGKRKRETKPVKIYPSDYWDKCISI